MENLSFHHVSHKHSNPDFTGVSSSDCVFKTNFRNFLGGTIIIIFLSIPEYKLLENLGSGKRHDCRNEDASKSPSDVGDREAHVRTEAAAVLVPSTHTSHLVYKPKPVSNPCEMGCGRDSRVVFCMSEPTTGTCEQAR